MLTQYSFCISRSISAAPLLRAAREGGGRGESCGVRCSPLGGVVDEDFSPAATHIPESSEEWTHTHTGMIIECTRYRSELTHSHNPPILLSIPPIASHFTSVYSHPHSHLDSFYPLPRLLLFSVTPLLPTSLLFPAFP